LLNVDRLAVECDHKALLIELERAGHFEKGLSRCRVF
jgi:hypothetical protein